jgi:hypothetical protein
MVCLGLRGDCFTEKTYRFLFKVFFLNQSGDFVMSSSFQTIIFEAFDIFGDDFVENHFLHESGDCFSELINTG